MEGVLCEGCSDVRRGTGGQRDGGQWDGGVSDRGADAFLCFLEVWNCAVVGFWVV